MKKCEDTLHFIVKSYLLGQVVSITTLIIVFFVGKVNVLQLIVIGLFAYIFSLFIMKFFDPAVEWITHKILNFLDKHPHARNFILKHF